MTTAAVALDRLMAGVVASLSLLPAVTVVWAPSEYPRAQAQTAFLAAKLIGGPSSSPVGGECMHPADLPTDATVTITGGGTVLLRASGWYWEATGVDAAAVRTALLAAIAAAPFVSASFVAGGAGEIVIEADELGDLYGLAVSGPATLEVDAVGRAMVQHSEAQSTVEIQAYSAVRYPYQGAASVLSHWLGTLWLPSQQRILDRHGLAMLGPRPGIVDLTSLSGPGWESRAAIRLPIGQISLMAEPMEAIESVVIGFQAKGSTPDPILVTVEAEL